MTLKTNVRMDRFMGFLGMPTMSTYSTAIPALPVATTTTKPETSANAGTCVFKAENGFTLRFCGTDANNETFQTRVVLWEEFKEGGKVLYVPTPICLVTATLSSALTGVAKDLTLTTSVYFADTLTIDTLYLDVAENYGSAVSDSYIAPLVIANITHADYVALYGSTNGKTAASFNWLVKSY